MSSFLKEDWVEERKKEQAEILKRKSDDADTNAGQEAKAETNH